MPATFHCLVTRLHLHDVNISLVKFSLCMIYSSRKDYRIVECLLAVQKATETLIEESNIPAVLHIH